MLLKTRLSVAANLACQLRCTFDWAKEDLLDQYSLDPLIVGLFESFIVSHTVDLNIWADAARGRLIWINCFGSVALSDWLLIVWRRAEGVIVFD